ncbi:hypothetical protein CANARDRAFT_29694 [[Candida] arabinofermentans NRRL YB-2248]|uniref:Thioredoxin domain-containing protein n=1 Tax=[Candida] arabinofermentans NRRL YB-2248 TaxID=983967 RepID=A0A1E4SW19_9ASCO|nr:hypothetical protein CANARDRAFT_29694 [[Candida] arabinofermentans NRRL YB-2248]
MLNFLILIAIVWLINKFLTQQAQRSNSFNTPISKTTSTTTTTSKFKSLSSDKMVAVIKTLDEFTKATSASNLVVVDFFAVWCGPCKMIAPMLEKFAKEYSTADFYKVDVDESPEISSAQDISSMPTLLFFKGGELVGKVIGANPAAIKQALTKFA